MYFESSSVVTPIRTCHNLKINSIMQVKSPSYMFCQLLHMSQIHTSTKKAIVYISYRRVEQRKNAYDRCHL